VGNQGTAPASDHEIPPGVVRVEPYRDEFYIIRVGRERGEKRVCLSRGELSELVRAIRGVLTPAELTQ
jgi:hypothetical protein